MALGWDLEVIFVSVRQRSFAQAVRDCNDIPVMPWPGFEPGCLAALPPQSGGHVRASNSTVVHDGACSWLAGRSLVIDSLVQCDGRRIPGAKRGPTKLR